MVYEIKEISEVDPGKAIMKLLNIDGVDGVSEFKDHYEVYVLGQHGKIPKQINGKKVKVINRENIPSEIKKWLK